MNFISAVTAAGLIAASVTFAHPGPAHAHDALAVADALESLPLLSDVAPEAVQISPHVPNMGAHWANPGAGAEGPFYCVIEGRVVCVEYMFPAAELAQGRNWRGLVPGIATPPISHFDIEYLPEGIPNRAEPLYQVHAYFAGEALLAD